MHFRQIKKNGHKFSNVEESAEVVTSKRTDGEVPFQKIKSGQ